MSAETARFIKGAGRCAAGLLPGRKRRRAEEALRRHRRQPLEAQLAQVGSWEWDLATDRVSWSAGRVVRVVGLTCTRERVQAIGGQLTPCSAPGAGTRIQAQTAARMPS